jgi:hypothetical protein
MSRRVAIGTITMIRLAFLFVFLLTVFPPAFAQTLSTTNVEMTWSVVNRFRFFRDEAMFKSHETAWRQYLIHARNLNLSDDDERKLVARSSVIGTEHVLNDRFIPFTQILRTKYDWRGWAARMVEGTCWDLKEQGHTACGGRDAYLLPSSHQAEFRLRLVDRKFPLAEYNCEWRVDGGPSVTVPCDESALIDIPYPAGGTVSVNLPGEAPISKIVAVKDLLIVGLGDSFASGEGNPDVPVQLSAERRSANLYPTRAKNDVTGNAQWTDEKCHRSLYSQQLRAALQVAIENSNTAVTFLGYSCSGAGIEEGILGPQTYVDYVSRGERDSVEVRALSGGKKDAQLYRLMADLCRVEPEREDGLWVCPEAAFRRKVDLILLSVGGNDIGFSGLVAWSTLRDSTSSKFAKFLGTSVSAKTFSENMQEILPGAYAKLAKALEAVVPVSSQDVPFDASRIVLSAYPDILVDEAGEVCAAGEEGEDESAYTANQSLDRFSSWLVVTDRRIKKAHEQLAHLHARMAELAEDHRWTFAGRSYADKAFRGRGFCAVNRKRLSDPAEILRIPCWSKSEASAESCSTSLSGGERAWRPYNPSTQSYPYALRQRWVRTFNDVYMIVNQKVLTRDGRLDERASNTVFSETTGAMHPSAEGHAAMADALLLDVRSIVEALIAGE